jgi:hypothetical protein
MANIVQALSEAGAGIMHDSIPQILDVGLIDNYRHMLPYELFKRKPCAHREVLESRLEPRRRQIDRHFNRLKLDRRHRPAAQGPVRHTLQAFG